MKMLERLSVLKPSVPGSKRVSQIPLPDNRQSRMVAGWALLFWLLSMLVPDVVQATNGLNLIGSGGISSALAGADTAVATDFTSMNTNPAGMTQIRGTHAGFDVGVIKPQLRHKDSLNNIDGENEPLVIPNLGYIRHLTGTPVTLGIGFFTVGGNATDFRDLRTQFGTTDKACTHSRHYKLTPSIAYEVTDKLSLAQHLPYPTPISHSPYYPIRRSSGCLPALKRPGPAIERTPWPCPALAASRLPSRPRSERCTSPMRW